MNDIEKLEERIAQLTELVNTGTETLESLKETLKTVEEERDRLADLREPKFERVEEGEKYYYVDFGKYRENGSWFVDSDTESGHSLDAAQYNSENYFHTEQRAKEVADKFNFLLKLERLHDIYCPDYTPDWDGYERKYYVTYGHVFERYSVCSIESVECKANVFFPTWEIAEKVCNILNAELEEKK